MIASLLLATSLFLGTEHAVSAPLREASPYEQRVSDAAASHDVALVVWRDADGVRGARVDRDGRQLDPRGFVIDPVVALPVAARGDDRWLVAWLDDGQVKARFVFDDGSVGARMVLPLSVNGGAATPALRIAFDGTQYFVLLAQENGSTGVLVDENGQILGSAFPVNAIEQGFDTIDLVVIPSGYAVVYSVWTPGMTPEDDQYSIKLLHLHEDGVQFGNVTIHTAPFHAVALHAVPEGEDVHVLWGTDVQPNAEVLIMRSGEPPRVLADGLFAPRDLVAINGRLIAVLAVLSNGKLRLQPIDTAEPRTLDVSKAFTPAAVSFGDRALIAANVVPPWAAAANDPGVVVESDPYAVVVNGALADVAPLQRIALEPRLQANPAVARNDAGETLAVWNESAADGPPRIAATRLDYAGRPLDVPPLSIVETPHAGTGIRPLVASDGSGFLVAWNDGTGMMTRRVLRDGTRLPQTAIDTHSFFGVTSACLCRSGNGYLLGFVQLLVSGRQDFTSEIQVLRLDANGAAAGEPFAISSRARNTEVACATGPHGTLFVWRGQQHIDGVLIGDGGTVSAVIPIGPPATIFERQATGTVPAVAANGNVFAVVWSEPGFLERALVSDSGTVTRPSDPVIPAALQPSDDSLDVAPHGDGFVVAWGASDILAILLDSSARVAAPAVVLSAAPGTERQPALVEGMAVYLRDTAALPSSVAARFRVFTRTLADSARRRAVAPR
jgi:hypothetical protein